MELKNVKDNGEIEEILNFIKKESETIMEDLMQLDDILLSLQDKLEQSEVKKEEIIETIQNARLRIGAIETEDKRELEEEEIADTLVSKIKKWINLVV